MCNTLATTFHFIISQSALLRVFFENVYGGHHPSQTASTFLWPAIRSQTACCLRRMVEVAGVEPASEMASPKLLRVYPAFDLGNGKRTSALSRNHPFGSAPCSGRAELPAAWPDRLSLPAHLTSAVRLRCLKRRAAFRNCCSQLQFFLVFYVANENPRRAI